jgi:sodium/proline symporter
MSSGVLTVLVIYGVLLFGIGLWGRRASGDVAGYYVAGKKLPSWVIAFSSNTTGESAWLLLGLTGMGYAVGIHALWIVLGEVLGVTLGWVFVASRFKEFTDRYDSVTIPDFLESRFRDTTNVFRWISLIIIFSMVAAYTSAQFVALGKAFNSFLGMAHITGIIISAVIILFYTTVGGLKAVAYSDLLQGILMFLGLLILPFVGLAAAGGWTDAMTTLRADDPALLAPMGSLGFTLPGVISAIGFVGVGLAFLGAPQLLIRFMSARSRRDIVDGGLIAVICVIVFDLGAVFAGMAGRAVFPGLLDQETILPVMTTELFPAVFTGIFLVIVLAASMSTVDSLVIMASSAIARDVIQKIFKPDLTQSHVSTIGKVTTVVIGIFGVAFAIGEVPLIFWLVLFAWAGLASAFTPVVLCSLFWKRTTRAGAIAGMIAGFTTAVVFVLPGVKALTHDLYEMIPGFAAGFAACIAVSLFTQPPSDGVPEFDEVASVVGPPFG